MTAPTPDGRFVTRMCLIAFAWNAHPEYRLVMVANRDEYHARPTAPLAPWVDAPTVLGGRDLKEGGGWLALDANKPRLAAVTNVREPPPATPKRSRGGLIREYLTKGGCAASFAERHRIDGDEFAGFNLLVWDGDELIYETNRPEPAWTAVAPGCHGISNGQFDPPWRKTRTLTQRLADWLGAQNAASGATPDLAPLFAMLADETKAAEDEIPETWVGRDRERSLSSAFIRLPGYGTRASSVILIRHDGSGVFAERSFDEHSGLVGERQEDFRYGAAGGCA